MQITDNTEELRRTFNEYVQYNRRDMEFLRQHVLKDLTFALHKEALAVAPTKEQIAGKVKSLGWRIINRGTPEKWGKSAAKKISKVSMRGMKKPEREAEKARRKAEFDSIDTTTKMQRFVISKRSHHIGYMATAYALAARLLDFSIGKVPGFKARKTTVSDDGHTTTINATAGGINDVDARTGFVRRAINSKIADIQKYIDDRIAEGRIAKLR